MQSDHFDGDRYHNPGTGVPQPRGLWPVLRWQLRRRRTRARWPGWIDDPPQPPPPAEVPPGIAAITFIGHATFLIAVRDPAGGTLRLVTDPMFSPRCSPFRHVGPKRVRAPGLSLAALPPIDAVLLSHNHYDHLDLPSLRALRDRFAPAVFTPPGNAAILARGGLPGAVELDWWQAAPWRGLVITATPARHFSARGLHDRNRALWGGFMIDAPDGRVLFGGDSGAGPHWAAIRDRLGAPDLALLPIGAYEPRWFMSPVHMDPAEAVAARAALGATRAIGMHFGTFQLTDEAIDAPERCLAAAREGSGLDRDAFDTLAVGETRLMPLRQTAAPDMR